MTADPRSPDACVIGVDFGTLSGRAVRDRAVRERVGDGRAGQARTEGGRS
jgi:hypothetical protein